MMQPPGRVKPQGWDYESETIMGFGKDGKGVILRESLSIGIGTLAAFAALKIGTAPAILERYRIIKSEIVASITGVTAGEMNGLYLGLSDGDLTLAELEAAIENNGPLGPNDTVSEAVSMRPVWWFGVTHHNETLNEVTFQNEQGGYLMSRNVRWTFARTKSWSWFVYNMGTAPTTGATLSLRAKNFGVWVT